MVIGASTSNFYPAPIEDALDTVLAAGFSNVEIFLNAPSEATPLFADELKRRCEAVGAVVSAVHPYSSFMEPFFLFAPYERRADDGFEMYKPQFEAAARLGAPYLILHGAKPLGQLTDEQVFERYERLYDLGTSYGVAVAQENVNKFSSADLSFLRVMKTRLGDKAKFVFDVKQSGRCGLDPASVIETMGDHIVHVHISDRDDTRDCLPPGAGTRDFKKLLQALKAVGYDGVLMLELYRANFESAEDLRRSKALLEEIACHL